MLWFLKALISTLKEGFNYSKEHLYLQIILHKDEMELEKRRAFKR
jgi:hypothetical protein